MAALGKLTGFVSSAQKYLGKYWMTNEGTVRVHVHDISIYDARIEELALVPILGRHARYKYNVPMVGSCL